MTRRDRPEKRRIPPTGACGLLRKGNVTEAVPDSRHIGRDVLRGPRSRTPLNGMALIREVVGSVTHISERENDTMQYPRRTTAPRLQSRCDRLTCGYGVASGTLLRKWNVDSAGASNAACGSWRRGGVRVQNPSARHAYEHET